MSWKEFMKNWLCSTQSLKPISSTLSARMRWKRAWRNLLTRKYFVPMMISLSVPMPTLSWTERSKVNTSKVLSNLLRFPVSMIVRKCLLKRPETRLKGKVTQQLLSSTVKTYLSLKSRDWFFWNTLRISLKNTTLREPTNSWIATSWRNMTPVPSGKLWLTPCVETPMLTRLITIRKMLC
jgi:hypothetical protein